jgi:hypothetical protein
VSRPCIASLPVRAVALAALLAALSGCTTQIILPVTVPPDVPPNPVSPTTALGRLSWSWTHRDLDPCRDLFTCDYEFVFAAGDSAGIRFQNRPWTRPDEIDFALHLFQTGNDAAPPASYVALDMEINAPVLPDDRPGKDPRWHRRIDTPFVAVVEAPGRQFRVLGFETFYFVRGDSACIPQELRDRGFEPDSTRWWIERWEEYVVTAPIAVGPSRAQALRPVTLGAVKSLYLDSPFVP